MRLTLPQIKPSLGKGLIPLLLILLLGWALRLYALEADSLWGDEIFSYERGTEPNREVSYKMLVKGNHPPLYELVILHEWLQVGHHELLLRFPSAFFGTLTISVVYLFAKTAFDRKTALLSALLLAISPLHVYYSREARMYGLLACLLTFALYFLYRAIKPLSSELSSPPSPYSRILSWAAFSFFIACCLYTHYYTFFTLLAIQGFILAHLLSKFDSALLKGWIGSILTIILLFSPWLPTFFIQLNNDPVEWIQAINLLELLEIPIYFFAWPDVLFKSLWWLICFVIWLLFLISFARIIMARRAHSLQLMSFLYLTTCFVGTLLIAYLISFFKPLIVIRYFMGIVPLTCILFAFILRQKHLIAKPITALIIMTALFSSIKIATSFWQEDWRGVTDYIEQHSQAHDRIVLFFPVALEFWVKPFLYYYDGQLPFDYVKSELLNQEKSTKAIEKLAPHQRLWVIQSARETLSGPLPDTLTSPFPNYRLIDRQTFNQALVPKEYTVDLLLLEPIFAR